MNPDLEKLVELYARLRDTPADGRAKRLAALREECERHVQGSGGNWQEVMAFAKRAYFKMRASEDKRAGRPPGFET